ncbi:plasma membrane ascorbate-dependent reductase CYBRD1-like [Oppia nitens]|uniref:plasma membrane ascorbate-dependent reductase CYBRD1-like n=1 Tax=Oppia nitens TaxID=1686743 RepID=UPI0023DAC0A9|nr:plasma membrane ascorbate-dependent reductase CYBRD1-like [Oppia nitens]
MASPSSDDESDHPTSGQQFGAALVAGLSQDNIFYLAYVCIQVLGICMITLCSVWTHHHLSGYSLATPEQVFNYHPLLMTIGMIVLNGNGILIYRISRWLRFQRQKLIHFSIQLSALTVSAVGLYAVFHYHNVRQIPNMYSLHSWLGITAIAGFTVSLLTAFLAFLYPGFHPVYRRLILPFHIFNGTANIVLSASVAITGLTEKALFSLQTPGAKYSDLPAPAMLINFMAISIAVFTVLVVWLVTKPEFRRRYIPSVNAPQYKLRREQTIE